MKTILAIAASLAVLGSSAYAQTAAPAVNSSQMDAASSSNDQKNPSTANRTNADAQNASAIEKIRQDLQKAGFTDVKVVARSFVVQARSHDGDPVVMTIGPHGMSVFEAMSGTSGPSGTTGMGAGGAASPDSSQSSPANSQSNTGSPRSGSQQ